MSIHVHLHLEYIQEFLFEYGMANGDPTLIRTGDSIHIGTCRYIRHLGKIDT